MSKYQIKTFDTNNNFISSFITEPVDIDVKLDISNIVDFKRIYAANLMDKLVGTYPSDDNPIILKTLHNVKQISDYIKTNKDCIFEIMQMKV